ncbi:MAG: hypothetical protein WAS21_24380, partial [Geminicoccaceae bacterium]
MAAALQRRSIDHLGVLLSAVGALAVVLAPFLVLKANRLAAGTPHSILAALPWAAAYPLLLLLLAIAAITILTKSPPIRLAAGSIGVGALALAAGYGADWLVPAGERFARVSPGAAFWLLLFALAMV